MFVFLMVSCADDFFDLDLESLDSFDLVSSSFSSVDIRVLISNVLDSSGMECGISSLM